MIDLKKLDAMHSEATGPIEGVGATIRQHQIKRCSSLLMDAWPEISRRFALLEWHSMETAPKDGEYLLLWDRKCGRVIGTWNPGNGSDVQPHWSDTGEGFELDPTHWMHLPDAPIGIKAMEPTCH